MKATWGSNGRTIIGCSALVLLALVATSLPSDAERTPAAPKQLLKRVNHDDPEGMRLLGQFYWAYQTDPEALKKAVFWIERAATVDDHPAQIMASDFYEKGIGVPQNAQRSTWFAMHAAHSGDANSQYRYAHFLETGYGVEANVEEARTWYRRAAEQGQPKAAAWMGADLARDTANADALRDAVHFLAIAARQGDADSAQTLASLSGKLDPIEDFKPNVSIRKSPSQTADVVARTAPVSVIYSLGERAKGWVEVYRPDGYVTGYASTRALTGS